MKIDLHLDLVRGNNGSNSVLHFSKIIAVKRFVLIVRTVELILAVERI